MFARGRAERGRESQVRGRRREKREWAVRYENGWSKKY